MAKFHDLLSRVADDGLRAALKYEYEQSTKHKKFGLVFEEHLPECTPLWGMKIRRGMTVARKDGDINDVALWRNSAKNAILKRIFKEVSGAKAENQER